MINTTARKLYASLAIGPLVLIASMAPASPAGEKAEQVVVSQFAPNEDLLAQVDDYLERIADSLSDPAGYSLAKQSRTLKEANTLAMLALVLSQHDADFAEKSAMPAVVKAAQQLAATASDTEQAQQALAQLQQARQGKAPAVEPIGWEKVASLPLVMKQVPLIHAALKRGATPRRLDRTAEKSAGLAAALAAIAQASIHDNEYAGTPEELAAWQQYCVEMRDAAGAVNKAVHARDAERVQQEMDRMLQSCEACHDKFR